MKGWCLAFVTGQRWDVLSWNAASAALLTNFSQALLYDRNILLYIFTDTRARTLFGARWAHEAQRVLALFRSTNDLWAMVPPSSSLYPAYLMDAKNLQCGGI